VAEHRISRFPDKYTRDLVSHAGNSSGLESPRKKRPSWVPCRGAPVASRSSQICSGASRCASGARLTISASIRAPLAAIFLERAPLSASNGASSRRLSVLELANALPGPVPETAWHP
jgi:hypothetical protein